MSKSSLKPDLEALLIEAAQDGQNVHIASSMLAMAVTSCEAFLRDIEQPDGTFKHDDQVAVVGVGMEVRGHCEILGRTFADKLYKGEHAATRATLAEAIAHLALAVVVARQTAKCCDVNPRAAEGAALMGADALIKDLERQRKGGAA